MDYQKAKRDLAKLKQLLSSYQTLFLEDGLVDTKEQRKLDQLQASIAKAEQAIRVQTGAPAADQSSEEEASSSGPITVPDVSRMPTEQQRTRFAQAFAAIRQGMDAARRSDPQEASGLTQLYQLQGKINAFKVNYGQVGKALQDAFRSQQKQVALWEAQLPTLFAPFKNGPQSRGGTSPDARPVAVLEAFVLGEGDPLALDYSEIERGQLSDGRFVTTLASIAQRAPQRLEKLVQCNGDGSYDVSLYAQGAYIKTHPEAVVIQVTNEMFSGERRQLLYAGTSNPQLWPLLVEKAFAIYISGSTPCC